MNKFMDISGADDLVEFAKNISRERLRDISDFDNLQNIFMRGRKVGKTPTASNDTTDSRVGDFNYDSTNFYFCIDNSGTAAWRKIPWMLIENSFEDISIPATLINPTGSLSPPGTDTTDGGFLFDSASTEIVSLITRLPNTWASETSIRFRVHWTKTTSAAGNVYWRLEYKWAPVGEVYDASWTTLNVTAPMAATTDNNTANEHLISEFSAISTTGKTKSDIIIMKLSRIGGDAADTYGADARLLAIRLRYQLDSFGNNNSGDV